MKNFIFLFLFAGLMLYAGNTTITISNNQDNQTNQGIISNYCDGWASGYCEGWKDVKGELAICPITPICPIAEIGKTSYKDGYNRGFKSGRAAAKK